MPKSADNGILGLVLRGKLVTEDEWNVTNATRRITSLIDESRANRIKKLANFGQKSTH